MIMFSHTKLRMDRFANFLGWFGICLGLMSVGTTRLQVVHAADPEVKLAGLTGQAEVFYDQYDIPHVYATTWADAARVIGYLHASDRLWQMDLLRRQASGNLAEVLGPDVLPSDQLMRQLGIRAGCEELWKSNLVPSEMRSELMAYADGVNAKIAQLGKEQLPLGFQALGYQPEQWTPVDSLVFSKYMGWDQSGTMDDLWFGSIVEKMGPIALEQLWPVDRPYEQSTISQQSARDQALKAISSPKSTAAVGAASSFESSFDLSARSELQLASKGVAAMPDLAADYMGIFQRLNALPWFGRGSSFGSNNWAVDGTKTQSGKPMICSDPHLGFKIPSIWYTAHLSVKGQNVAGVTFPGSPTVVIGHNDDIAWGITNMQADAVDFYIETTDPKHPDRYIHQGQWQEIKRTVEMIPVRGAEPYRLVVESTVHGPIIDKQSQVVSLCWTGLGMTTDGIGFWEIARARNLPEFLEGLDQLQVPALNMVYGDVHGNIAMHCCGRLPIRARGQGRVPMDGSTGENDWQGWIPRDQLPLSINPDEHFVASANGRPHPLGFPHYLGWMWDPSYRTRRIKHLLGQADDLDLEKMKKIQFDYFDHAAASFLPDMLPALDKLLADPATGKELAAAIETLKQWDYLATPESLGPNLWLRWLEHYRQQVWGDEWQHFGIEKQDGSWGFCGDNGREPMLEVLEFLTRQMPQSQWFDDRRTPQREDRDAVLRSSFAAAVDSLQQQFGTDSSSWSWKNTNLLKIQSLSGQPELSIDGGPVVGTAYTLNPGGDGGHVGGGASWRMIVDFGDPAGSIGVYPGGQSEQPTSPHYADQVPLWAAGDYVKLNMVGSAAALPAEAKKRHLKFR